MSHTAALEQTLAYARTAGADAAEVFVSHSQSLNVGVRMGTRETLERSEHNDLSLRVFVNGAQAAASTSDTSPTALRNLADRVVAMARAAPRDPYCGLADADHIGPHVDVDLFDPSTATVDDLESMARSAEDAALATTGITNSVGAGAHCATGSVALMTSTGLHRAYTSSSWSVWMTALAENEQGMERDSDWSSTRYRADLDSPDKVGAEAARLTLRRLGARKIKTQVCPVVFDRDIATRLISPLLGAISGAAVARGVSFLKDKLNTPLFLPNISIFDDPFIPRGMGSAPFDREGVKRQKRALIDQGVLTTWLMQSSAARQLNLTPTGHAGWDAGSPPGISSSNVYVAPGQQDQAGLLRDAGTGVLITDMFGPSLNSNTGDWSAGAAGFWFENGVVQYPVNEITVAGNLIEMYGRMIAGTDLEMTERTNSPSLLVDGLTIAGQ